MILHCYTSTYNDLYMIRWYVRYYSQFAEKIFVYDDDSTDGTREFLETCPKVQIISPGFHGIDEVLLEEMREREYKIHSRGVADWVIVGDSDELVYHPSLQMFLEKCVEVGVKLCTAHGYQMLAEHAPEDDGRQLPDHIKEGIVDPMYNRLVFNPEFDLQFPPGMHNSIARYPGSDARPDRVVTANLKMLHYKYIGLEHIQERHNRVWSRSSDRNKQMGWGIHNSSDWHGPYGIDWYKRMLSQRKAVI